MFLQVPIGSEQFRTGFNKSLSYFNEANLSESCYSLVNFSFGKIFRNFGAKKVQLILYSRAQNKRRAVRTARPPLDAKRLINPLLSKVKLKRH